LTNAVTGNWEDDQNHLSGYATYQALGQATAQLSVRIIAMVNPKIVDAARGIGFFSLYAFIFWRIFRGHPGNRVIQCGSVTLMLFMVMLALMRIPQVPVDYVAWLGPALFLLCTLTMFFLFQQGYRTVRGRFKRRSSPTTPD
jgi:hypothetical protein